jgi:predicted restriction endonuclease
MRNNQKFKKKLMEIHNSKCAIQNCTFNIALEIHHLRPVRLGGDDVVENLILLCPNHHAMADRGLLF